VNAVDTTQPGWTLLVTEADPNQVGDDGDYIPDQVDAANDLLDGLFFPWFGSQAADVVGGGAYGSPAVSSNMWYWTGLPAFNIVTEGGFDFPSQDGPMPGIPGTDNTSDYNYWNIAAGFQSYVVFPSPGMYYMGVNSDDGFRLTEGIGLTRHNLHVTGAGFNEDVAAAAMYTGQVGYGAFPPATPIVAPVVYLPAPYTPLPAVNLTNKIGAIQVYGAANLNPNECSYYVQTNGGLACILIWPPDYGMPYVDNTSSGLPATIPMVLVIGWSQNGGTGGLDFWRTNTALVANIGADTHLMLGQGDPYGGKGMGDIDFNFYVPAAGAYPLRLIYYQGTGGAGLEWFTLTPNYLSASGATSRSLLNNPSDPHSLPSYRALKSGFKPVFTSHTVANGMVTFTWQGAGILQSATHLDPSNWSDVWPQPGTSTYSVPASQAKAFYRLRLPTEPTASPTPAL
jgi:hypothetical protein